MYLGHPRTVHWKSSHLYRYSPQCPRTIFSCCGVSATMRRKDFSCRDFLRRDFFFRRWLLHWLSIFVGVSMQSHTSGAGGVASCGSSLACERLQIGQLASITGTSL